MPQPGGDRQILMHIPSVGTLRRRIEFLLIATLVPVLLLILLNSYTGWQREKRDIQQQAYRLGATVSSDQEQFFRGTSQLLEVLSSFGSSAAELCPHLEQVVTNYPTVSNIAVAEAGEIVCRARRTANTNPVPRQWLDHNDASQFVISSLVTTELADQPAVLVAQRHRTAAGLVLVASLNLDVVVRQMEAIPLPAQSSVAVVGSDRVVVARIPENGYWRGRAGNAALLDSIEARTDGVFETTGADGVPRLYGYHRPDLPGRPLLVTVGIPSAIAYADVNRRLFVSLGVLVVVIAIAFIFARRLSRELFERKIASVLRAARSLSAGHLDARTGEEWTPDELGELARSFDAMAWTLEQRSRELEESIAALRALTSRLETIREEERTRISREIHDELGQALTGVRMDLDRLEARIRAANLPNDLSTPLFDKMKSARDLIDGASETARRISRQLRPSVLDVLGFRAAVEWQLDEFRSRTGIDAELLAPDVLPEIDEARSVALFRILQETLTNVMRHSQATQLTVRVDEEDDSLVLEVMDNGVGFDIDARSSAGRLGLLGMRERAASLGGKIDVESSLGHGTTVKVQLPLSTSSTTVV